MAQCTHSNIEPPFDRVERGQARGGREQRAVLDREPDAALVLELAVNREAQFGKTSRRVDREGPSQRFVEGVPCGLNAPSHGVGDVVGLERDAAGFISGAVFELQDHRPARIVGLVE